MKISKGLSSRFIRKDGQTEGKLTGAPQIQNTIEVSKYRQPSFATVLQRALIYTYITTCFG
jgi:hypothetical protein